MKAEQSSRGQTQRKSAISSPLTAGAQARPRSQPSPFQGSSRDHVIGPLLLDNLPVFTHTYHRQNAVLFLQEYQILFPTPAMQQHSRNRNGTGVCKQLGWDTRERFTAARARN